MFPRRWAMMSCQSAPHLTTRQSSTMLAFPPGLTELHAVEVAPPHRTQPTANADGTMIQVVKVAVFDQIAVAVQVQAQVRQANSSFLNAQ